MSPVNQITSIETRQAEIAEEIARLQEEASELAIAAKVIKRLESAPPDPPKDKKSDDAKPGLPRPSGAPTNFEMVDMVLASAEKEGRDGLSASEIVDEIRRRYWPGLIGPQILSPIYQFAKNDRLKKTASGKFKRIKKTKDGQSSAGSHPANDDDQEASR